MVFLSSIIIINKKNMKLKYLCISLFFGLLLTSCKKEPKIEEADASFLIHKLDENKKIVTTYSSDCNLPLTDLAVNGKELNLQFQFTGKGYLTSVWTGDSIFVKGEWGAPDRYYVYQYEKFVSGIYSSRNEVLTIGRSFTNKGILNYKYNKPGVYKVTVVATNAGQMDNVTLKRSVKTITITVPQ